MDAAIKQQARERMKGYCRVCPACDGRACAGEVPGMGGLGTGSSFRANVEALREVRLAMRCLHKAVQPKPECSVLGLNLSLPVLAAPIGGVSFNMGGGPVTVLETAEEKRAGLLAILAHVTGREQWDIGAAALENTQVFRLDAEELTCKVHP